ncbi:MAG: hypothetical protein K2P81_14780 [Bacteriovoracaceae bacterium]|nr:hypothetical protein [Bacteriovoracaceae bacterium]
MQQITVVAINLVFFLLISSTAFSSSQIIDHKGANNPFDVFSSGCAARKIDHLNYPFMDNTLESIQRSFDQGADAVEIDLRATQDGDLVLFQEPEVDCLTEGQGLVREHTVAQLKKLDFGYWVYDKIDHYPLRGSGVGKIVTLREVLRKFPHKNFLLNPKDRDLQSFKILVKVLSEFPGKDYSSFSYWGSYEGYVVLKKSINGYGDFIANHHQSAACFEAWRSLGLFGIWPNECTNKSFSLNLAQVNIDWWGFPFPFLHQAKKNNLQVWLFNTKDKNLILGLSPFVSGIIASDLREFSEK